MTVDLAIGTFCLIKDDLPFRMRLAMQTGLPLPLLLLLLRPRNAFERETNQGFTLE